MIKTPNGSMSLNQYFNANPGQTSFKQMFRDLINDTQSRLRGQHLPMATWDEVMNPDRVFIHQPVRAVRYRKYGGILNKLNSRSKKLLGI